MTRCSDYEVELSALMDGESDPAMAIKLVAHVASCESCAAFVRDLGDTQVLIDRIRPDHGPVPASADVAAIERKRVRVLGLRPQWAVGIAALLVVTLSIWFGSGNGVTGTLTNDIRHGELFIRLEEDKGRMSDERFVALVSELLRADRRYQNEMYLVLSEITNNRESRESGSFNIRHEDRDNTDRSEPSRPITAAMD